MHYCLSFEVITDLAARRKALDEEPQGNPRSFRGDEEDRVLRLEVTCLEVFRSVYARF